MSKTIHPIYNMRYHKSYEQYRSVDRALILRTEDRGIESFRCKNIIITQYHLNSINLNNTFTKQIKITSKYP